MYVLFDSDISTPVSYGSKNLVAGVISQLPKSVTIFYYEPDNRDGWKMKMRYKPNGEIEKESKARERVEEKKNETQEKKES